MIPFFLTRRIGHRNIRVMARIARAVVVESPYYAWLLHSRRRQVTQRGVRSMGVFYSDKGRSECLRLLLEEGERLRVRFVELSFAIGPYAKP